MRGQDTLLLLQNDGTVRVVGSVLSTAWKNLRNIFLVPFKCPEENLGINHQMVSTVMYSISDYHPNKKPFTKFAGSFLD